ncbi:citrate synthase [Streptomyces tsukubensis]|uniref:citrate synthase (unknown stereospecificity) n=1 Tax=Streptomyces tsukubensis TaxID=83656 RepID=A0A1V4A473_9ACTN|nr:citrate synthase [Streptomyces tsukubensis]OON75124.1 citrate synthase [Streptomyces tsukubensis]QFR96125.1 helix-turn-helix domain-containing protein [Streptomyces tsukubensis]
MTDRTPEARQLTTKEVARFLGVKPETVYAYVSRGQLTSRRGHGGRGSTFDAAEVEALAHRTRREAATAAAGDTVGRVRTGITLIEGDRYYYRGVDATELAARFTYEEVAEWLWTGALNPGIRFTAPPAALESARRVVAALPEHSAMPELLRAAAVAAAAADPLRFDLSPTTVLGTARGLIPTLVDALPPVGATHSGDDAGQRLAWRLWSRLTPSIPDGDGVRALDSALVLLMDHDLAASTLAARVAASSRAHPYAVVSAGLGATDGPLHGAASGLAHRMLAEVLDRGSAGAVVADHLRAGRRVPGLGHRIYQGQDPRAEALFGILERIPGARPALEAARAVERTTAAHVPVHANIDLAVAALTVSSGMASAAGETMFAVARTVGWIAHALEEYEERPSRMRPNGEYTGARPPMPLPSPSSPPPGVREV